MAKLKTFSGFPVQNLSSDSTSVGQIYYNSTSGQFKAIKNGGAPIGTWSSGGNLNTGRKDASGFGEVILQLLLQVVIQDQAQREHK